jgi:hypothetical protein
MHPPAGGRMRRPAGAPNGVRLGACAQAYCLEALLAQAKRVAQAPLDGVGGRFPGV